MIKAIVSTRFIFGWSKTKGDSYGTGWYTVDCKVSGKTRRLQFRSIDFDLAIGAAPYYGIEENEATQMVGLIKNTINHNWQALAKKYGIGRGEIERMKLDFKVC